MCSARYRKENEATVVSRLPPSAHERSFQAFLWNRKAGTVLGRTGSSWALIGIFYIVFYTFLAGFFSLCMFVFYQTLDHEVPKYSAGESLLRNPGLSFRPLKHFYDDLRPTLDYHTEYKGSFIDYVNSIEDFLKPYNSTERPANAVDCMNEEKGVDEVCYFNYDNIMTSCTRDNDWGYKTHSPCLLLKLNKMFHWEPEPTLETSTLPTGLQEYINNQTNPLAATKENVWVWCESEEVKIEQLSPGLHVNFFPYYKQKGYMSPFVIVRILDLPVDEKVKIRCRAWAKNIKAQVDKRLTGSAVVYFHRSG